MHVCARDGLGPLVVCVASCAVRAFSLSGFQEVEAGMLCFDSFDMETVISSGVPLLAAGEHVYDFEDDSLSPRDRALLQRVSVLERIGLESASQDAKIAHNYSGYLFHFICIMLACCPTQCSCFRAGLSDAVTADDLLAGQLAERARQMQLRA